MARVFCHHRQRRHAPEEHPDRRKPVLSPGYDFVATLPYIPNDKLALSFGGSRRISEITQDHMRRFADTACIPASPLWQIAVEATERTVEAWKTLEQADLPPDGLRGSIEKQILAVAATVKTARTGRKLHPRRSSRRANGARMTKPSDPYNLQRFVDAQKPIFERACSELRAGQKVSHWMWFIFPQIRGLGSSPTAVQFAISSRAEAQAYLAHRLLGARLRTCTGLVNLVQARTASQIFGHPDDLKFRSSMTLFAHTASDNRIFQDALDKYFEGQPDPLTLDRL